MSRLVALVFDDTYKAEEAKAAVHRMGGEGLLEIDELAMITKDKEGKAHTTQDEDEPKKEQKMGHVIGLVAAAVTGVFPLILASTIGGRLVGRLKDHGITNKFLKNVDKELQPGTSALVILARSDAERRKKILERLIPLHPKILESDFPPDLEHQLEEDLQKAA